MTTIAFLNVYLLKAVNVLAVHSQEQTSNSNFASRVYQVTPTYPGFIVIKTLNVGLRLILEPSKSNMVIFAALARYIVRIYYAMTDNTSKSIRLNSSKQAHAPEDARPLKNLAMAR